MRDGVELEVTRWFPAPGLTASPAPIMLSRTPYGGHGPLVGTVERLLAGLGYQAVMVQCRGTFASGGTFDPIRQEVADGADVFDWLHAQPWFTPNVGLFGASYLGFTQWSALSALPPWVKMFTPALTTAEFRDMIYAGGAFALDTAFTWGYEIGHQQLRGRTARRARTQKAALIDTALATMPLGDAASGMTGPAPAFLHDWLAHAEPGDPWWDWCNFREFLPQAPAVSLIAGWQDLFLDGQLTDFRSLQAAGRTARITIGPWTHASPTAYAVFLHDAVDWADRNLLGRSTTTPQGGARIYVSGSRQWRAVEAWPPPFQPRRLTLAVGGLLLTAQARESPVEEVTFRYDPADPTPSAGGATLNVRRAGVRSNGAREDRADVISFTAAPLTTAMTCAGHPEVSLTLRTSSPDHDLFVRLCDVTSGGESSNVADGVRRFRSTEEVPSVSGDRLVTVALSGMAHTFHAGHRIRLQVSGGAHPLVARNLGYGESLLTGRRLRPVTFTVTLGGAAPPSLLLPEVDVARLGRPVQVGGADGWPLVRRAARMVQLLRGPRRCRRNR